MPTCRPTTLRPTLASIHCIRSTQTVCGRLSLKSRKHSARKYASAAAVVQKAAAKPEVHPERPSVRTVLHKAESLLPRVLSVHDDPSKTTSLAFWQDILKQAYESLNASTGRGAARIVVYGTDEYSGAEDLVTALLEEPFAPDSHKQTVQNRWKNADGRSSLLISHAFTPSEDPDVLNVPLTWLKQFAVPVELEELKTPPSSSHHQHHNTQEFKSLFSADVPIIVVNPVTTPIQKVLANPSLPLGHANAILVVVTSPNLPSGSWKKVTQALPESLTTVFVDPQRAIGAIRTLSMDPGSSLAVQRYQDDYTGSRVADLSIILKEKISEASQGDLGNLNEVTALEQVQASLAACRLALENAEKEVGAVVTNLLALRDEVAELEVRVEPEILGREGSRFAMEAVERARKEVEVVMDSLTWWKAVSRVDDVGEIARGAVDRAWCRELEDKLIFHAGRLATSQRSLAKSTTTLLSQYISPSPFHSPILENSLSQLQASSSYPIRPTSLTSPIHQRKAQLAYPIQTLHSTAQGVALGTGSSVLGGLGIAWAGWAEHLGILGDLLGSGMQVESAIGAGMLVSVAGIRWVIARWEKAKKKWWRDWDRVGQGLERDLKTTLDHTVSAQLTIVPTSASEALNGMVKKRREEIETLKEELDDLQHDIKQS